MSLDITVHHFHPELGPSSSSRLLETGHRLVDAATGTTYWRSVNPGPALSAFSSSSTRSKCFVWARAPPILVREALRDPSRPEPELADWDAPFEGEDILDVHALPDFEATDLDEILRSTSRGKRKLHPNTPMRHFADDVDVNLDQRLHKRRRSHISSYISISTLIPFPHYHESPDPLCPPPPDIEKIPAFRIARTLSIRSLKAPFARMAWLVPLRGHSPFDGASSAHVCHSTTTTTTHVTCEGHDIPLCIQWTPPGIEQFWSFLLRQRSMNNFGPIALSYAFSPCHPSPLHLYEKRREEHGKGRVFPASDQREHIKIYHDARYAMKLRSLLDSFRWEEEKRPMLDTTRRNRVLKGALLVLVDEKGDAVLLA